MRKYLFGLLMVLVAFPAFAVDELTEDSFDALTKQKSVVMFYSPTCPHCKNMEPALARFEKEHPEYKFGKINVETNRAFAERNSIKSWPVFRAYDIGLDNRFFFSKSANGEMPYEKLERLLTVGESISEKIANIQDEFMKLAQQRDQITLKMENIAGQLQILTEIANEQPQNKND